jgi:hypothetical protein
LFRSTIFDKRDGLRQNEVKSMHKELTGFLSSKLEVQGDIDFTDELMRNQIMYKIQDDFQKFEVFELSEYN